jgi:hypothetical protein
MFEFYLGKKLFFQPSTSEITVRTRHDVIKAINRLSIRMPFAHQLMIINCYSSQHATRSGSFLFLHLAPISSIRSSGLFTNLNATTYSVMNLIRQWNKTCLCNDEKTKRYLFNDCLLNRILKNYLSASQQTLTALKIARTKRKNLT